MSGQRQSSLGFQFFLVGTFAWIAAALFALLGPRVLVKAEAGREPALYAPNLAAAGAAVGFGIGGGLCFLGAAILYAKAANSDRSGIPANQGREPTGAGITAPRTSTSLPAAPAAEL